MAARGDGAWPSSTEEPAGEAETATITDLLRKIALLGSSPEETRCAEQRYSTLPRR